MFFLQKNINIFFNLLKFYFLINVIQGHVIINFIFYSMIITLMALSVSNPMFILPQISLSIIWINIFLSFIFSLENLLHKDCEDGTLDLYYLINFHLEILLGFKLFIHWIIYCISLILFMPVLNSFLNIPNAYDQFYKIIITTIYLNSIGFITSALILGFKQRIFLLYLIIGPMFIPCVIFSGENMIFHFVNYLSLIIFIISPLITSYILKKSLYS